MEDKKKTPMLDPDMENEQNIKDPDSSGDPNSKPKDPEKPTQENPEKVPESNDPAGYGERGNIKRSPPENSSGTSTSKS